MRRARGRSKTRELRCMIEPVTFAILSRRLDSIARTMQHTLVRSSRSGVIASGHDCSCCILSANSELLTVAETIPIHVMSGADAMAKTMVAFHPQLERGDAFLHNSPYHGCTHAADMSVLVPVFDAQGRHRFTVLSKSHQADVGNAKPTTYMAQAEDLYAEGALIFPAVRLQHNYKMNEDIVRMGRIRIRSPEQWYGDLLALVGAARTGEAALERLAVEFGWDTLEQFADEYLDFSENEMMGALEKLPAGSSVGESTHDPFPGTPAQGVTVRVKLRIDPAKARITADLRDNVDCLPNGLNMSEATARSAAMIGVFNCVGALVPVNAGSARRIDVVLREGCALGIPWKTTSCSVATTNLADRVVNAVHLAMSEHARDSGMAEAGAIEGPAGAVVSGLDPRHGNRNYINQFALAGTAGAASATADGWLTMGNACSAGMWTMDSIEVNELNYPMRINERCLLQDSEGAGRYCGAPSCRVVYEPSLAPMQLHYAADGSKNPARGVHGGRSGGPVKQWLLTSSGNRLELDSVGEVALQVGDQIVAHTSGGGGYGPPTSRVPESVADAVREGLVSVVRAESVYRVICSPDGTLDVEHTAKIRAAHAKVSDPA
jgi:N-methylhydantoinase B